jgi:hypothetical protein
VFQRIFDLLFVVDVEIGKKAASLCKLPKYLFVIPSGARFGRSRGICGYVPSLKGLRFINPT